MAELHAELKHIGDKFDQSMCSAVDLPVSVKEAVIKVGAGLAEKIDAKKQGEAAKEGPSSPDIVVIAVTPIRFLAGNRS